MSKSLPAFPVRRILIRVNNWIGDVVMISPSIRAVRRRFPDAEITLLAKPWVVDALRPCPDYDRLVEYDRERTHRGTLGRLRLIRHLRCQRYDLALLFQKAFEAALFAWAAGIPHRVGFRSDVRGWLLSLPLEPPTSGHYVDRFLQIVEAVGCDPSDHRISFHLSPSARDYASTFLMRHGIDSAPLRVAFHPGASKQARAWHPQRLARVATSLMQEFEARPIVLGSATDRPALESISEILGESAVPLICRNLQEMAALLAHCHLLVCNDSGPMHIAAALRVPVVAVFGPGSPNRTSPFTDPNLYRVVSADYPCSPCRQDFFRECIPSPLGKPYCLEDVRVESVVAACRQMLPIRFERLKA